MRIAASLPVVLSILLGGAAATAASSDMPLLQFEPSLDASFERAKKEKIRVLGCVVMEGEPGCEAVIAGPYQDKEFAEIAEHAACVVGCVKPHGERTEKGSDRKVCDKFGSITCAEHLAVDVE